MSKWPEKAGYHLSVARYQGGVADFVVVKGPVRTLLAPLTSAVKMLGLDTKALSELSPAVLTKLSAKLHLLEQRSVAPQAL